MTATEILAETARLRIVLTPNGDNLHVDAPKGALTPELKQALVENKRQILFSLRDRVGDGLPPPLDRPPETEMELRRLIDHLEDPVAFTAWLEWAMNRTDPAEGQGR